MTVENDNIANFLPKYPNTQNESNQLFSPYDGDFYNTIYRKKEFYELRLEKSEKFPIKPGELMRHQQIIARYLSSHTPYDGVFLHHEMGTGKTCAAIGAIEQIKKDGGYRGAIYIASATLSENFLDQLIEKCTDGRYIPEDLGDTERKQKGRYKKAISDFYKLGPDFTYQKFAKNIAVLLRSPQQVQRRYNNYIIVIDEVHNLADITIKETKSSSSLSGKPNLGVYDTLHKFLHTVQGCKILLLSGTPMRNGADEIASVMNLILPSNEQLPKGSDFTNSFFTNGNINEEGLKSLRKAFKGRVSYLRAMTSDVKRVFHGQDLQIDSDVEKFKIFPSEMGAKQLVAYVQAWKADNPSGSGVIKTGVYQNSRQASLFVFPDGSYGKIGFEKYISETSAKGLLGKTNRRKSKYKWSRQGIEQLKSKFAKKSNEEKLNVLAIYSSKYANSIKLILEAINSKPKKLIFVYNEFVKGGGLILFGLLLRLFGFSRVVRGVSKRPKTHTFAVLTGDTSNTTALINIFNRADNLHGDYINLILGSKAVAEGVSLNNVQVEIVQSPWFNYARIDQALSRGYRAGSHRTLLEGGNNITLNIYLQATLTGSNVRSIEMDMYRRSQEKDIGIKKIERIIRRSAFDCALSYQRNKSSGRRNSRECDYGECNYECVDVEPRDYQDAKDGIAPEHLDYSTYQLYYAGNKTLILMNKIRTLFQTNFLLSLVDLGREVFEFYNTEFELLTALHALIGNHIPIRNKYGFTSYLQEENDLYFLVDSLSIIGTASLAYYTKYPNVKIRGDFTNFRDEYYTKEAIPKLIQTLCASEGPIHSYILRLPLQYQELLLESALIVHVYVSSKKKKFTKQQKNISVRIQEYFSQNILKISSEVFVSSLLFNNDGILRCLDTREYPLTWKNCNEKQKKAAATYKSDVRKRLEKGDFYGLMNNKTKAFCIRDVSGNLNVGGHKQTSGKKCSNWSQPDLVGLCTFFTKLEVPISQETKEFLNREDRPCGPEREVGKSDKIPPNIIAQLNISWKTAMEKWNTKGVEKKNAKMLRKILKDSANRNKDKREVKSHERYIFGSINFPTTGKARGIAFKCLLEMGGAPQGENDDNTAWRAINRGIDSMTLDQLQRIIYFSAMTKIPKCLLLCEWCKNNNILIYNDTCGDPTKKKIKLNKSK